MRFYIVAASAILLQTQLPGAAPLPRGWSLGPAVSGHSGASYEIVRAPDSPVNQNRYLSLLRWDIKPAFTLGVLAEWNSGRSHSVDFAFHAAVPGLPSGEMNDFDWFFTDRSWSHWSVSDTILRWGFIFDFNWNWVPIRRDHLHIVLGAGYHLDWWSWRDITKNSVYSTTAPGQRYPRPFKSTSPFPDKFRDRTNAVPAGINSINFNAAYQIPLGIIGIGLQVRGFFISTRFRIGPAFGLSHDHHVLRRDNGGTDGLHFYEIGFGGLWTNMSMEIGFRTAAGFSLRLLLDYARLTEFKADTITASSNGEPPALSPAAAALAFCRLSAGITASWPLGPRRSKQY